MALPTFLPFPEAAEKLGVSERELRKRVEAGTITAGKLPDGEIVVSTDAKAKITTGDDINARLSAIKRSDFEHLRGTPITVSEAAKKYGEKHGVNLIQRTIDVWVKRGYVKVIDPNYPKKLDESDVAYCAMLHAIRKQAGIRTGFALLNNDGSPGLLKHPNLSRYRREQRQAKVI